jgi:hypothetical protein
MGNGGAIAGVIGLGALVIYLAMLATAVKSSNTSKIASALGTDFDGSISTAEAG